MSCAHDGARYEVGVLEGDAFRAAPLATVLEALMLADWIDVEQVRAVQAERWEARAEGSSDGWCCAGRRGEGGREVLLGNDGQASGHDVLLLVLRVGSWLRGPYTTAA